MKQKVLKWPTTPGRWSARLTVRTSAGMDITVDFVDADASEVKEKLGDIVGKIGKAAENLGTEK